MTLTGPAVGYKSNTIDRMNGAEKRWGQIAVIGRAWGGMFGKDSGHPPPSTHQPPGGSFENQIQFLYLCWKRSCRFPLLLRISSEGPRPHRVPSQTAQDPVLPTFCPWTLVPERQPQWPPCFPSRPEPPCGRMDEDSAVWTCEGVSFSFEKEGSPATWDNSVKQAGYRTGAV